MTGGASVELGFEPVRWEPAEASGRLPRYGLIGPHKTAPILPPPMAPPIRSFPTNDLFDAPRYVSRIFVLPEPNHPPPSRCELTVGVPIPSHVARDLGRPVVRPGLRQAQMLRAAVPEASVEQDDNTGAWKEKISGPAEARERSPADEVPQPSGMHARPDGHLQARVPAAVRRRCAPGPRRDGLGRGPHHGQAPATSATCSITCWANLGGTELPI